MAFQYALYLLERGHSIKFLVMEPEIDSKYMSSITVECLNCTRISYSLIELLKRKVDKSEIFLSIIPLFTMVYFLSCYLRLRVPNRTIFSVHNNIEKDFRPGFPYLLLKLLYVFLLRKSKNVYAVSTALSDSLKTQSIENKLLVNSTKFMFNYIERELSTKLNIMMVGRFTRQKDYQKALEFIEFVNRDICQVNVEIFGDGEDKEKIRQLSAKLGLDRNISFKGYIEDVEQEFENRKHNVLLLTSKYEGFGLVVLEAISKGIFPIVRDCPYGPKEIVDLGAGACMPFEMGRNDIRDAIAQFFIWEKLTHDQKKLRCQVTYDHFTRKSTETWKSLELYQL